MAGTAHIPRQVPCPDCGQPRYLVQRTRFGGRILDLYWRCHECGHRIDASGVGDEDAVEDFRRRWRRRFAKP